MNSARASSLVVLLSGFLALGSASALSQSVRADLSPRLTSLLLLPGMTIEKSAAQIQRAFMTLDANGDGLIDEADAGLHEAVLRANARFAAAGRYMNADADGDGFITLEEFQARYRYDTRFDTGHLVASRRERLERDLKSFQDADTDRDGKVSWVEAGAAPTGTKPADLYGLPVLTRDAIAAFGGDARSVDLQRFTEKATELIKSLDVDGNGTVSPEEYGVVVADLQADRKAAEDRQAVATRGACLMPKASERATVVLLSAYETDSVSTATIGSQDVTIGAGSIQVEPGEEPLYVVISTHSGVIWDFTGATQRLERIVLSSSSAGPGSASGKNPLVAAKGVGADKVVFMPHTGCLPYFSQTAPNGSKTAFSQSKGPEAAVAIVRRETGKEPVVAAHYEVSGFSVPSGAIKMPPEATKARAAAAKLGSPVAGIDFSKVEPSLLGAAFTFFPGGVVAIDPSTVVAVQRVTAYEVLPSQLGLIQLMQKGVLTRNRSGAFLIHDKMRFPAGLYGAHSARFVLLDGVPAPEGIQGHSCLAQQETDTPVENQKPKC